MKNLGVCEKLLVLELTTDKGKKLTVTHECNGYRVNDLKALLGDRFYENYGRDKAIESIGAFETLISDIDELDTWVKALTLAVESHRPEWDVDKVLSQTRDDLLVKFDKAFSRGEWEAARFVTRVIVKEQTERYENVRDVHTEHCCTEHGCKYNNPDCTVTSGEKPQSFPCEMCGLEREGYLND